MLMRRSFFFILWCSLFLQLSNTVVTVNGENFIWYYQGYTFNQKCNSFNEFFENYPLVPLKYHEYHTPYSYNIHNSTGILNLGYGVPCTEFLSLNLIFDSECNHYNVYPLGYIMYNPDVRFTDWYCLGEDPRIARYHASYATVTVYTNNNFYQDENTTDVYRKITCSSICILGGQKVITDSSTNTTIIQSTPSVLCGNIITNLKDNNQPIEYTINWIDAEPLPYTVVGATAIYSNGTLFVIGGIRGNYDRDTTNSILEADIDPNTCLPYNWRNYGYNDSSRIGNPKQYLNWTNPSVDSFPANVTFNNKTNYDILENRTLLWATEGPPALPKLSREYIYDNFPHIYPQSYYPTILTGGGITIPSILNLTPDTFGLLKIRNVLPNHDSYCIPLQPLDFFTIRNNSTTSNGNSDENNYQKEIIQSFIRAQFPAIPVNLNLPLRSTNALDTVILMDCTHKYLVSNPEIPIRYVRTYRWYYHYGTYVSIMNSFGDILNTWEQQYNELIRDYDDGFFNGMDAFIPASSNLLYSFIGKTDDVFVIATDPYVMIPAIGYSRRCTACSYGTMFISKKCIHTPYEGSCSLCTSCSSTLDIISASSPSYLVSPCTREYDTQCRSCTQCLGGPPLQACNATSNTVCNPELEALVSQPKWKRIPISDTNDRYYGFIFITIITVWLLGCFLYSIHKTQLSTVNNTVNNLGTINNDSIMDILYSFTYRRTLYTSMYTTFYFLCGNFTIFTYIYFNTCILTSVVREEATGFTNSLTDNNQFYMGKELRSYTYQLCIVNISLLIFSILLNNGWLIYQYRYSFTKLPFLYYILLPYMSFHHRLVVWMDRTLLIPFEIYVANSSSKKSSHHSSLKLRTYGETIVCTLSSCFSDGIHLLTLLLFSDMYSATVSNARPVTIGVALCGLVNIFLSAYRLFFVFISNSISKNILLSKDVEIIMKTTNHENNNPINVAKEMNTVNNITIESTDTTTTNNNNKTIEHILVPSINTYRHMTVARMHNITLLPIMDTSSAPSTTVLHPVSMVTKERKNLLNDISMNHGNNSGNNSSKNSSSTVSMNLLPHLANQNSAVSPPLIMDNYTKTLRNVIPSSKNNDDTIENNISDTASSSHLSLSPSLQVKDDHSSDTGNNTQSESSLSSVEEETTHTLSFEERCRRIRSQFAQSNNTTIVPSITNSQTIHYNNVALHDSLNPTYFTYVVDNCSVSSSSSENDHRNDKNTNDTTNIVVFDMAQ